MPSQFFPILAQLLPLAETAVRADPWQRGIGCVQISSVFSPGTPLTGVSVFGPLAEGQHRPTLIKNLWWRGSGPLSRGMCPQNKGRGKVANSYQPAAGWDPKRWWTISKRRWGKGGTHTFGQAPRMGELMGRWGKAIVHSLNLSPQKISLGHPQPPQARRKRAKKPISFNPTMVRLRPGLKPGRKSLCQVAVEITV